MPKTITSLAVPFVELKINGGKNIGEELLAFEWKSFVNGGYIVRAKVADPYFRILREFGATNSYLSNARQGPTPITFKIGWIGGEPGKQTMEEPRTAFISDLDQYGRFDVGQFEFVAVDPPSYLLNAGYGEGKVYKGNISSVIKEVIGDFAPGINVQVTETDDDKNGLWPMMRQDPKTFIQSMLDWSANLTPDKTHWLTNVKDMDLYIKEQSDLKANKIHYGNYNISFNASKTNDVRNYSLLTNNFLSIYQNSVVTQGISAVSGKFIDKKTDMEKVEIRDENTGNKLNVKVDPDKSFSKPNCKWATSINGIPEHNAGDIGIKYEDYLGGRARQLYLNMLPMVMRLKVSLDGSPKFDDPSKIGVSTLTLNWKDLNDEDFFLSGKWIVYGFHHKVTLSSEGVAPDWTTDAYIYRLDHNANAKMI
jgi:hypothetical protein